MNWIVWELRRIFSKFLFYRTLKGGYWYLVRPKYEYGIYGTYWINRKPLFNEIVIRTEVH